MKLPLSLRCLLVLSTLFAGSMQAQQDCQTRLYEAYKLYESGRFEQAIALLDSCTRGGGDDALKARACKLISFCHLSSGDSLKASAAVKQFMNLQPTYVPNITSDPASFCHLVMQYRPRPRVVIGMGAAAVMSRAFRLASWSLSGSTKSYTAGFLASTGLYAHYLAAHRLRFTVDVSYLNQAYGFNTLVNGYEVSHAERSSLLHSGLVVARSLTKMNTSQAFGPYFFAGMHYRGLLTARADLSRTAPNTASATDYRTDLLERRRTHTAGWDVGCGYASAVFFAELHLSGSAGNVVNTGSRYTDIRSLFDYFFLDDDFMVANLQLRVGLLKTLSYHKL